MLIAIVLVAAAGKATHIALYAGGSQPDMFREEAAPRTSFDIVDRGGMPLAVSVECFDLSISPQAMWRSHTPRYMAERIAEVLGDAHPDELLERMMPSSAPGATDAGADGGLLVVREPRALLFTRAGAERVRGWIASGPYEGFWLAQRAEDGRWTLAWDPVRALSRRERLRHQPDNERRPERWTRHLLNGLIDAIGEEDLCALDPERFASRGANERRAALQDMVWEELMPSRFRVVRTRIEPRVAHELTALLAEEAVSSWQMSLDDRLDRRYPVRPVPADGEVAKRDEQRMLADLDRMLADGTLPTEHHAPGAFSILGSWGVLEAGAAARLAQRDLALEPQAREWSVERRRDFLEKRFLAYQADRRPRAGLELAAARELSQPYWGGVLETGHRTYGRRVRHLPRDCRQRWDQRIPDYYQRATDAPEHPRVVVTLDADLQRFVHAELEDVLVEQSAAVAMAIALDVESGDVLAVDGVSAYETSGFAPVRHLFTPGSTLKAVVMAIAHEAGYVEREESFATHAPDGLRVQGAGCSRHIREALGAPDEPWISAEAGLARSVNAVLVQIGLRVPSPLMREQLVRLGYGRAPVSGLGHEVSGRVPPLDRGLWSHCYTHASISFGHEISVSLWQHAAALATIARGGAYRPLRLIEGMEQHGQRWELPFAEGQRVFSERTCRVVRDMMASGAEWGTGRNVASYEHCPEFAYLGTKTGTTEKVHSELCLHVELAHQVEHVREGSRCSGRCASALKGQRDHQNSRQTCYTSSMWAVGRLPEDPATDTPSREVMVLVVVDDPAGKDKYGSDVAGPSAIRILRRAVGLSDSPPRPEALGALTAAAFNRADAPWSEAGE